MKAPYCILLCLTLLTVISPAAAQVDLDLLFAPPIAVEISDIAQEWSQRTFDGTDFLIERTAEENGFTIARVSFRYEGLKQYAMLRYPRNYLPSASYPLLMLHHGGTEGFYYTFGLDFDIDYPTGCLAEECWVLVPTYRGEAFTAGEVLGSRVSEGEKSLWDRDCDDAMALLTVALVSLPNVDASRLYSWGRSRGAGVTYHMALRDPRLLRSEVFFGPTDFFQDYIKQDIQATLDGGPVPDNTLSIKVWEEIVSPLLAEEITLQAARSLMIAWSPVYFVDPAAAMQIHHGEADPNIPVFHAENFSAAMMAVGANAPDFELFTYPDGNHSTASLIGHQERVEDYLCLPDVVALVPELAIVPALEAWPNPFAHTVQIKATNGSGGGQSSGAWGDQDSQTRVQIFDMRGRLIRRLALPSAGAVQWDGTDLLGHPVGAGIYFMNRDGVAAPPLKLLRLR